MQRRVLVEDRRLDVLLDRSPGQEAPQVHRDAAADRPGPRQLGGRVAWMEASGLAVVERAKEDLRRAPSEQRTVLAQDLALHEPEVRATQDQEDVAGGPPASIPCLLQDRRELRALGHHPLELVERDHELTLTLDAALAPALDDGIERTLPGVRREGGQEWFIERRGRLDEELAALQLRGRLLPEEIDPRLAVEEPDDQLALADAAPPVDRNEGAFPGRIE